MKKHRSTIAAALLTAPVSAADKTAEDVFQTMREIGLPEGYVQEARNQYNAKPDRHDDSGMEMNGKYRSYDEWILLLREKGAVVIYEQTAKAMGVSVEDVTLLYGDIERLKDYEPSVKPEKPFRDMTLEEKRAYVDSLPEEERAAFLVTLTPEERNSILKQLPPEQKQEVAGSLIDLGHEMGMNITVSDPDELRFEVRDDTGTLIDTTGFGLSADATGWDTTIPVLGGTGMILLAVGGLTILLRLTGKQEDRQHG